jgi:hypothetical protein
LRVWVAAGYSNGGPAVLGDLPDEVRWAERNLREPASDIKAIEIFGPRDGR